MTTARDIPCDLALKLCNEIRAENKKRWFSIWRLQCLFCYRFAKGKAAKLCLASEAGCPQVNQRYKHQEHN